jgi:hypothetical protein
MIKLLAPIAALAALLAIPAAAFAVGSDPLNISTSTTNGIANGDSGGVTVSGDNRKIRLVAFHSDASNLVAGDSNGKRDIFVWERPAGSSGETLNRLGIGSLKLVSVGGGGVKANGHSQNPVLDGSMKKAPHCVAFESQATNLSKNDATPDSDVYVRDLKSNTTYLASSGVKSAATNPAISGNCKVVLFESGGAIWGSTGKGGKPRKVTKGSSPDIGLDGTSFVWVKGGKVKYRRGKINKTLGSGSGPQVSDGGSVGGWAVAFNSGGGVKLKTISKKGAVGQKHSVPEGVLGGITAYAADRGIITFRDGASVFDVNLNTGNTDTLARSYGAVTDLASSARANLVAFAARGGRNFTDPTPPADVDQYGNPIASVPYQSVYVKFLPATGCGTGC